MSTKLLYLVNKKNKIIYYVILTGQNENKKTSKSMFRLGFILLTLLGK